MKLLKPKNMGDLILVIIGIFLIFIGLYPYLINGEYSMLPFMAVGLIDIFVIVDWENCDKKNTNV